MNRNVAAIPDREVVIEAIYKTQGNVTEAAKMLNYTFRGLNNRIAGDLILKRELKIARNQKVDKAELVIDQHLEEQNLDAAKFVLKTLGKDRGWTERYEIVSEDGKSEEAFVFAAGDLPVSEETRAISAELIRRMQSDAEAKRNG
jgi:hypothetical protein